MTTLRDLEDDWLDEDDRDVLEAWSEFVASIVGPRLAVGHRVTADEMRERFAAVREQGWLEFAVDEATTPTLYVEAVKRLHRRERPLAAPVLEAWSALRLLHRLDGDAAADLAARAASGEAVVVLDIASVFAPRAADEAAVVPFADAATVLIVAEGVVRVAAPGPAADAVTDADPTLPLAATGSGERVADLPAETLAALRAELLVAQAGALVGQSQALLASTLDYLTVREQFGVPIGSFQALRHRAADVATDLYAAQQLSIHAAERLADHPDPEQLGLLAKALCGRAAVRTASEAVQLRGGMGFTWEGDVHFGLKRIMGIAGTGPTVADCDARIGERLLDAPHPLWAGGVDPVEPEGRR